MPRHVSLFVTVLAAVGLSACTLNETPVPRVAGPSELALSLQIAAEPDLIRQDGSSTSAITIVARGPDGQPARNVSLRADIALDGTPVDFGTLSSREVSTDNDGQVRLVYTPPPAPPDGEPGHVVTILVRPIGTDARSSVARQVDISVIPPGVIMPPNGAPVPALTISPSGAPAFTPVNFDASGTTDEGTICGGRCAYTWNFGDGSTANGVTVTHEYRTSGTFVVQLSVRDQSGNVARADETLTIGASSAPTARFVFSPSNPAPGDLIFFNASSSTAAEGHTLVSYEWDFGSGRTGTGMTVSKGYNTPGTYTVTLRVIDDAGQAGTTSQTVPVGVSP